MDSIQNQNPNDLIYQVMPKSDGHSQPQPIPHSELPKTELRPPAPKGRNYKLIYIIVGIIILIGIGIMAYFILGTGDKSATENQPVVSRLPKAKLLEFFGQDTCLDSKICGDDADPDIDGLTNYKEFIAGTSLMAGDTDKDGLSDGDEVNIFKTDPTDKYTDPRSVAEENDYNDGLGFINGYDPLTPGFKLTDTRKQQITDDIGKHSLHEPSKTTLKTNASGIIITE